MNKQNKQSEHYIPFEWAEDRLNWIDADRQTNSNTINDSTEFTAEARVEIDQAREVYAAAADLLNKILEETNLDAEIILAADELARQLTHDKTGFLTGYNDCQVCEKTVRTLDLTTYNGITVCKACKEAKDEMDEDDRRAERIAARKVIGNPYLEMSDEETAANAVDELTEAGTIKYKFARVGTAIFFQTIHDQHQAISELKKAGMTGLDEQRHPL